MTRPRLMIVGPLPPPIGGVETFTQAILESRALEAFEVTHCDTTKGRPKSTQGRFDAGNLGWAARHFARLARACARTRPQVVYIPIAGTWSGVLRDLTLGFIAKRSGARVIGHQHAGDIAAVLARRGLDERLVRGGLARFDRLLVLGERWRTMFLSYGIPMPCEVCPSTFRREVFEAGRAARRPERDPGRLRVLFVGQIGERKGVLDLLEAIATLRARGTVVMLTLVGPEQLPGELERATRRRDALALDDRVRFTGPLTGEALYAEFRAHDVFALPSYNEGIPAVLYEAGAFGLPVVTTPVGAIPDLVTHDVNGILQAPGDAGALSDAFTRLEADPALAERLGTRLRADVEAFHPDRIAGRIADAVWATLGARPGATAAR